MAASAKILDLRALLAERFLHPPSAVPGHLIASGVPAFDQATQGGLRKGVITELISPWPAAGSALLIHALLQRARRKHFFLALVDGADSFDPQTAGRDVLPHLLWARCEEAAQALRTADLLLRDGNFPIVILDLILNGAKELRRIPATSWYRLQRLVERVPTAFLVLSRHNLVVSARIKIVLESQWSLPNLGTADALARLCFHPRQVRATASF